MRHPRGIVNHRGGATDMESAMTPMIDVVFLLLVFFVWTSSFYVVEQILPSELSSEIGSEASDLSEPPPESDFDENVVEIAYDGNQPNWLHNDIPVATIDQLKQRLTAIANVAADEPVILNPDGAVPLGVVIETYDACKLSGFPKVSFAVTPNRRP